MCLWSPFRIQPFKYILIDPRKLDVGEETYVSSASKWWWWKLATYI